MECVLIDIKTCDMTFGEVLQSIAGFRKDPRYSDCDIFLDGDKDAIIARTRN